MPYLMRTRKAPLNTMLSDTRNIHSAKEATKNVNSSDAHCEIVFENTSKSTSSLPQKRASGVKQTSKFKKQGRNCKLKTSKVNCTLNSADKMGEGNIGTPSPQVTVDSEGCIVLDENSLVVERPAEQEPEVINENTNKHKKQQWSLEDTKKFYASLGSVQTDFSLMSHLWNNTRSRHELKLKFKHEERRNRDLVDKALSSACDVDALLNDKFGSGVSVKQNSSTKNNKRTSVGDKNTVQITYFKPRAKQTKRIRRFYFESDSGEEDSGKTNSEKKRMQGKKENADVQVISKKNGSQTNYEKKGIESSSAVLHPLPSPALHPLPSPDVVLPKSSASALGNNLISITGFNIRHPTVMKIGENGEKQAFDARVVLNSTEDDEVIPLSIPSAHVLSYTEVLPQNSGSWKGKLRQSKSRVSYKEVHDALCNSSSPQKVDGSSINKCRKVLQRKCYSKVRGRLDVVKLLLGHLKGAEVIHVGNETLVFPESEKAQKNKSRSKGGTSSEMHSKEPEVEIVFEKTIFPSEEYNAVA